MTIEELAMTTDKASLDHYSLLTTYYLLKKTKHAHKHGACLSLSRDRHYLRFAALRRRLGAAFRLGAALRFATLRRRLGAALRFAGLRFATLRFAGLRFATFRFAGMYVTSFHFISDEDWFVLQRRARTHLYRPHFKNGLPHSCNIILSRVSQNENTFFNTLGINHCVTTTGVPTFAHSYNHLMPSYGAFTHPCDIGRPKLLCQYA